MMAEIKVTDFVNGGISHRSFNRGFIANAKNDGHLISFASSEFYSDLYSESNTFNKKRFAKKYKISLRYLLFFYFTLVKRRPIIILSADNSFTPLLLMIIAPFMVPKKVIIIFHNNYIGIKRKKWKHRIWLYLQKLGFQFVVLSHSVKVCYTKIGLDMQVINHPILNPLNVVEKDKTAKNLLLLGRWNNYSYDKIGRFLELLRWCKKNYPNEKLLVRQNSVLYSTLIKLEEFCDYVVPYPVLVSQDVYLSKIRQCKAVLLPGGYGERCSASGILFDALSQRKEIICPKEDLFLEVLGKHYPYYAFEDRGYHDSNWDYKIGEIAEAWNVKSRLQLSNLLTDISGEK